MNRLQPLAAQAVDTSFGPDAPEGPGGSRCEASGRLIPYQCVFVGYDHHMKPEDMP